MARDDTLVDGFCKILFKFENPDTNTEFTQYLKVHF